MWREKQNPRPARLAPILALELGDSNSQVDGLAAGKDLWSCVGTRLGKGNRSAVRQTRQERECRPFKRLMNRAGSDGGSGVLFDLVVLAGSVEALLSCSSLLMFFDRSCPSPGGGGASVARTLGGDRRGLWKRAEGDLSAFGLGSTLWEAICSPAGDRSDRSVPRIAVLARGSGGVELLELDWRQVVEVAVQALGVVPVHPAERGELDLLDGLPRAGAGRAGISSAL